MRVDSRTSLTLVALVLAPAVVRGDGWPRFRGPEGAGVAENQNLPDDWDVESGRNVLWRRAIDGLAHSSPIVWGNRVYVTTAVADSGDVPFGTGDSGVVGSGTTEDLGHHRWELLAIDKHTGDVAWRRTVHEGVPRVQRHVKASHASATPVTDGEHLVALLGSEGLFCFELDGELSWRADVGVLDVGYWGAPEIQWGPASSPIIYDDLVIVQNDRQEDSFVAAYALATGEEVWRAARNEKPSWSTPAVYRSERGDEMVTNGGNWIRANDPRTGEELWRVSHEDLEVITPSPIVAGEVVIVSGGNPTGARAIFALRPGETEERLRWKAERGSPYTPTPLAYEGILYVIVDNGILSAYELATGERIYRARVDVGAGFSASPVAADGKIYLASEDGDVFVIRAGREYQQLARIDMGEALMATPAISDGMLILRGRSTLFAVARELDAQDR
jgi:outer membrane protein assembly factor BamB